MHCDGEYMKEIPCENEPTRDDEHLEREVATLQEDYDSVEIVEHKVLVDCELLEEEFIPISSLRPLNYVSEENEERLVLDVPKEYPHDHCFLYSYSNLDIVDFVVGDFQENAWIDTVKECRKKLRIILREQFTTQNEVKKEIKECILHIFLEEFGLMSSINNPKERKQ
ncbi:hypothetical protein RND71_007990 [Anisodus tanguticus]|uniref:Uncharacterized protein n=1 Tax=Anisodus tanguticus TaxID=243964 RepID=A0AAE1SQ02_9SOLA|nr:hypothetical protein RND71_007990 [Anisodus tanguticus]